MYFSKTPIEQREAYSSFVTNAGMALSAPKKWCFSGKCRDTNYGGHDRLHFRSSTCPKTDVSELTRLRAVAERHMERIDTAWGRVSSDESPILDELRNVIGSYLNTSYGFERHNLDLSAFVSAVTKAKGEQLPIYKVSVGFETFWETAQRYLRKDILKRHEEFQKSAHEAAIEAAVTHVEAHLGELYGTDLGTAIQVLLSAVKDEPEDRK